jgi:hypothetical protein
MRDKIADALAKAHNVSKAGNGFKRDADAIIAALPEMIAPLVWERNWSSWTSGAYQIDEYTTLCFAWGLNEDDLWTHGTEADTLEEAQAAANTHHRAAIMAAFKGETQ